MHGDQALAQPAFPLVSVIINCYNGMPFLPEAIESVYAQTYENWEIILWDNASSDHSPSVAERYDHRLRYFRSEENIPLGGARNKAIEQTRGVYICFLDCDDVWLPEKLAKQVAAMEAGAYALGYAGVFEMDVDGRPLGQFIPGNPSGPLLEALLLQFDINVPTAILRKAALVESGLTFDPNVCASEEYCLFMQLAVTQPFLVLPEPLAKYRIHGGALTSKSASRWALERRYTLDLIRKHHLGIEAKFPVAFREAYARADYYQARYHMSQGHRAEARAEMGKIWKVRPTYFALYLILFFPAAVWDYVHLRKTKRVVA